MLILTSLTIWLRWEHAGSGGSSVATIGETGSAGGSHSVLAGMEEFGFAGNSGSTFAGTKLVKVDLTSVFTVNLALNEVAELALHLAVHLALLRVGRGVLHTAHGGIF